MSTHALVSPDLRARPPDAPRHLRLVGAEELAAVRRRRRVRLGGVVLVASVIVLLFAAVAMHVELTQNQFRLSRLNSQAAAQQTRYEQLRLQVDQLSAPARIVGTAENRLGMVSPATVTYLSPSSATSGPNAAASGSASRPGAAGSDGGPTAAAPPAGWSTLKPQLVTAP